MKEHNKLVRDKVVQIIESNGEQAIFYTISDDQKFFQALLDKDFEESQEFKQNPSLEELADKLEVLYALAKTLGLSPDQIEAARLKKFDERGGFDERIFLESTS